MAYYTTLINAWNSTVAVNGVSTTSAGNPLTSTMTTSEKLAFVDGWTVTGTVPASILTSGVSLANCIVFSEFNALTAAQQSNVLALCQVGGQGSGLLGGSTNVGLLTAGMVLNYFGSSSVTIANLTALAKAAVTPWWQSVGYPAPFSQTDLSLAGLS